MHNLNINVSEIWNKDYYCIGIWPPKGPGHHKNMCSQTFQINLHFTPLCHIWVEQVLSQGTEYCHDVRKRPRQWDNHGNMLQQLHVFREVRRVLNSSTVEEEILHLWVQFF